MYFFVGLVLLLSGNLLASSDEVGSTEHIDSKKLTPKGDTLIEFDVVVYPCYLEAAGEWRKSKDGRRFFYPQNTNLSNGFNDRGLYSKNALPVALPSGTMARIPVYKADLFPDEFKVSFVKNDNGKYIGQVALDRLCAHAPCEELSSKYCFYLWGRTPKWTQRLYKLSINKCFFQ
jgi:hypothetical protein